MYTFSLTMPESRTLPPLGGVHDRLRTRVRRRGRRSKVHAWDGIDRALNPAFFRPRLRHDLEIKDFVRRSGERYSILKTPQGPNYMRLTEEDRFVLDLVDGSRTVKEIVVEHFQRFGTFSLSTITDLVEELRRGDFLDRPYVPVAERALEARARKRSHVPRWMKDVAATRRIEFRQVHRLFSALYRYGGKFFYRPPAVIVASVVGIVGAVAFIILLGRGKYTLLGSSVVGGVLMLYVASYSAALVHEAGHALSCVHYGRRVNAAGFMLYLGIPALFIETTDMWLADKRGRIVASSAGVFLGAVIAGACSLLALLLPATELTGFFYRFSVLSYIATAENLIPFLRLDGYYILMDAVEEVNLRERAFEFLREELFGKLRRRERMTRKEKLFSSYGVLAVIFSILAVVFSLFYWKHILGGAVRGAWGAGWPSRILIAALIALVLAPIVRALIRGVRAATRRLRSLAASARRAAQRGWRQQAVAMFKNLPLTEELPDEALEEIASHAELIRFRPGQAVVKQGERGDRFYVVRSGNLEVLRTEDDGEEHRIRTLEPGRSFGEVALLEGTARTATVRAVSPSEVFAIDKGTFDRVFAARMTVAEEMREALLSVADLRKLGPFRTLDDADAARLLNGASWHSFAAGERIVKQGDEADAFYVIESGQVDIIDNRVRKGRLGPGAYFGEVGLLVDAPRTATVRAVTPTRVLEIRRKAFDKVLAKSFRRGRLTPSRELSREWEH